MGVTQKEIARRLNLSQSLVARVLSNSEDVWVSAENRRRIHLTARELGYQPNSAARMLRTGKAYAVSCCYVNHNDSHRHHGSIIDDLAEELGRMDYELKVKVYTDQRALLAGLQQLSSARSTDAVVLWDDESVVEEQGDLLAVLGVPFVVKGRHEQKHPEWPQVDFDHEGMMADAVDFCAKAGRKRIVYIGHDNDLAYATHLRTGFAAAIEAAFGAPPPREHIILVAEAPETQAFLYRLASQWLGMPASERPDAVVFGMGSMVWQNLDFALHRGGVLFGDAPDQIMAVGVDYAMGSLIFGRGWIFPSIASDTLIQAMMRKQLLPILKGDPPLETVCRIRPQLRRMWPAFAEGAE